MSCICAFQVSCRSSLCGFMFGVALTTQSLPASQAANQATSQPLSHPASLFVYGACFLERRGGVVLSQDEAARATHSASLSASKPVSQFVLGVCMYSFKAV